MFGWFRKKEDQPQEARWAFWHHDEFPYFKCGVVEGFSEDGQRAKVNGKEVAYFYLAIGERGRELHDIHRLLVSQYRIHMECARNSAGNAAHAILTDMGFPTVAKLRQNGYQGSAYRDLFARQLPEKLAVAALKDDVPA